MFCPNCGAEVSEKAVVCLTCGAAVSSTVNSTVGQIQPKNWLVESILVTLFCCLPFGIAGIVNAANVSSRFTAGDMEGAQKASEQAGKWTKWGFWTGLVVIIVYVVIVVAAGGFAALSGRY